MSNLTFSAAARAFCRDESGVGTVWAIAWLVLMFGIGGLAVDITSAFRAQTALQSTADAAALAGTIELPKKPGDTKQASIDSAVNMAYKNMNLQEHGTVLMPWEVAVGDWDHANKTLTDWHGKYPTAVMVTTRRDRVNKNAVPVTFLRILSLVAPSFNSWNVYAQATAERFIPDCLTHSGMVARGVVDYQSNNNYQGELCIHSQDHVEVQHHNQYGNLVTVSMPDRNDLDGPGGFDLAGSDFSTNTYSDGTTLRERAVSLRLDPKMVDHVYNIIATLKNPALDDLVDDRTDIIPYYLTHDALGNEITPVVETVTKAQWNAHQGWDYGLGSWANIANGPRKIFHVTGCEGHKGGDKITIGSTGAQKATAATPKVLANMGIVTECIIDHTAFVYYANVVLASGWENGFLTNDNIKFSGDDILGLPDNCADGGGMFIASTQTVSSPAKLEMHGVQIVAMGDIQMAAKAQGLNGIHFQAGGMINVTSNEALGAFGCDGGIIPLITADYFRLVY
ncbi:MAG TPA: Tad domain-containing protein [Thermohalobaculum sp.]|nr:Tad domain-containing protein [Thermohalobaculum sp.]